MIGTKSVTLNDLERRSDRRPALSLRQLRFSLVSVNVGFVTTNELINDTIYRYLMRIFTLLILLVSFFVSVLSVLISRGYLSLPACQLMNARQITAYRSVHREHLLPRAFTAIAAFNVRSQAHEYSQPFTSTRLDYHCRQTVTSIASVARDGRKANT